ncbi:MAG: FlgD immunoglobulin-like domain containing protein, partial [bacterium]|nr:FlgD immunoglobulin-like domain containing protein [bacterium]
EYDATPVATANAVARTAVFPETSTTPHTYYVRAFNTSLPSDPSNTDVGSTYLKRFVSGPDGNVTGQNLAGQTDSLFFERPTAQCNSGSKIYLLYNVNTTPTQWGVLASCSLCTKIRFTLPNDVTLNYCQIALRCSSSQHTTVFTHDTTDSIFHLGNLAVDGRGLVLPDRFDLAQNFPNPFNPETQIMFNVPTTADVRIRVYNLMGQQVRTLTEARYTTGAHTVTWDGRTDDGQLVGAGVYLYRMETPGFAMTKKMLLMK